MGDWPDVLERASVKAERRRTSFHQAGEEI
jgi:hypothetical protein